MKLILKSGEHYEVSPIDIQQWKQAYPTLDVDQQLRNMVLWCQENPRKRKTERGVRTFIVGWLNRQSERTPKPRTTFAQAHRPFEPEKPYNGTRAAGEAGIAALREALKK